MARPRTLQWLLFIGAYVLFSGFAKWVTILPDTGISVWPPAGLFIATLILTDQRSWWWWVLAALAAELLANALWFRNALVVAVLLNAGNALCAVAGAWLVQRFSLAPVRLETLREVLCMIVLGAFVAPVIAATIGAGTLAWSEGQPFAKAWMLWWSGDAAGVLLVAPLLLVGLQSWQERAQLSGARLIEAALLVLALVAVAALSLGGRLPLAYIVMPPLLWAAIRFEFRGAVVALVLLALMSAIFNGAGAGPFAISEASSPRQQQLTLQLFLAVSALSALVVAAIARQQRQTLQALAAANERLEDNVARRTAELQKSEQRFRALTDSLPVIVWVHDAEGNLESVNPEYERFFGVTEAQVLPGGWQPLLHPDDAAAYVGAYEAAHRERREFRATARVRRADGAWRHVASHGVPRFSESGEFVGMVGSSPDVTGRVEHEQALAAEAQRKDDFLAMLAHELRNPLAPIRNASHLLAIGASKDPVVARASGIIDRQSAQLSRLVDDLLDVSRVAHGKVLLQRATHDAAVIVQSGVESSRALADDKRQQLQLHLPAPGALFVDGDAARLTQVVGNVVGNAVKYTPEGGHIDVTLRAAAETSDALDIVVSDDGPGIDASLLPQVFDLFVQGQTSIARAGGGLGIGLAMVRKLVELHGGSVAAHSDGVARGARFTIRLPTGVPLPPDKASAPSAPAAAATQRRHVLIVDDNADAADSLAAVLQLDGHEVTVCADGASGLARAREQAFDVVMLDLGLPVVDGYEVARSLRAEGASRGARLIAVTGYGQPEDRARTASAGFDAHCVKPVDLAVLTDLVQSSDISIETRLARRIDDARLLRLLDAWRTLRRPGRLPDTAALLEASSALEPWRAVAAVESLSPLFAMRFTSVGSQLAALLPASVVGRRQSDADAQWGSQEAAYRAVALRGEPMLDTAEWRFGPRDVLRLRRLIVPAGDADSAAATHLVAVVLFDDPAEALGADPAPAERKEVTR
jgi:PAS domain S-box-containing protein